MTTPRWYMVDKMGMATLCASKADAEKEAADAQRFWPHMGPHRAVQLVEVADVEAMRAMRAAQPEVNIHCRSTQKRLATQWGFVPAGAMLGEQAELRRLSDCCPELNLSNYGPDDVDELNGWAIEVSQCIDRALAAVDAQENGGLAGSTPASADESGTQGPASHHFDELLDALSQHDDPCEDLVDALKRVRALRSEVERLARAESAFVDEMSANEYRAQAAPESFLEIPDVQDESGINSHYSRELVLECINAALASHGQAPAQAIPAAAAGCTRSHPHENMDSACRAKAAIAEMQNMAARGAEATTHDLERFVAMLAAAPTTQPAPQQDAQEPVDSMGMPLSCGKPLCAPGNHHPLCKLAPPPPAPQPDSAPAEAVQRIVHLRADRERRVYVAGPMTGLPEYNFPLFNATAARLRSEGWHVENPAEHGHVDGAGWSDYLRWDISRIATCGAIYLLPGWSKSKGATLEVHIAGVLGLQVLLADGAEAPQADSVTAPVGCNNIPGMAEKAPAKLKSHIDHVAHKDAAPEIVQGRVTWLAKQSSPERPKSGGVK